MKKALIIGITGQDGIYLSNFLLKKGYKVFGSSRSINGDAFLEKKNLLKEACIYKLDILNANDVRDVIEKIMPDEIYNLAGQSSVGLSFEYPSDTIKSILIGTLNILEAIKKSSDEIRFFNAGSCEIYGDAGHIITENNTLINPISPYSVGKASAHHAVQNYRESFSLYACTGILGNHDSVLRSSQFVTKKLISTAYLISKNKINDINIGNLDVNRDWGFAGDYVSAMWSILQLDNPSDYIIASGKSMSLAYFAETTFKYFGLDFYNHMKISKHLKRPRDISSIELSPRKILTDTGWIASKKGEKLINFLCEEFEKSFF
jgi:GDPmannose 4,6-dehydratase